MGRLRETMSKDARTGSGIQVQMQNECRTVEHNIDGGGTTKRTPESRLKAVFETLIINVTEQWACQDS